MFISFYNKYIFYIAIIIIVVIFVYNIVVGNKGTYMNHYNLMWTEALKEFNHTTHKQKKTITSAGTSAGETECRRVAESLTGYRFPTARPDFLRNEITNANLEIDCFCAELGIGIEYNGKQHYEYVPHFHTSKDAFYNIKYRDQIKKRLCEENGINLIIVPYTVRIEKIEAYIKQKFDTIFQNNK
jgi:hypothetical protein